MDRDADRVRDMLEAAQKSILLVQDKTRAGLDDDEVLALALARLLEILGEAAKGVSEELRSSHPEIPWPQIAATRDRLIHGYFDVDLDIIWRIIKSDLPSVVEALEQMVAGESNAS